MVMDTLILIAIGLLMGIFGGGLGIGGSVIMIPALVWAFGEDQHLWQASAMICNFFVAVASVIVHHKEDMLVRDVIRTIFPSAIFGIIAGVALSNMSIFAGHNSYLLARIFGVFMLYLAVYNIFRFGGTSGGGDGRDISGIRRSNPLSVVIGAIAGVGNGLLGIGGGSIATPLQQLFLKMPLKRAMANSSAMIMGISLFGAAYKNATLGHHGLSWTESLRIAAIVAPTAIVGSIIGTKMMHKVHKDWVRAVFIGVAILAAWRLLTVTPK
jgi:uncharacterized membrane protein YfcA